MLNRIAWIAVDKDALEYLTVQTVTCIGVAFIRVTLAVALFATTVVQLVSNTTEALYTALNQAVKGSERQQQCRPRSCFL